VIKTLEAQLGQFLLVCKCPVRRFLPGRAKNLSASRYLAWCCIKLPICLKQVKISSQALRIRQCRVAMAPPRSGGCLAVDNGTMPAVLTCDYINQDGRRSAPYANISDGC
jgi:hypothetical protein